MKILNIIMKEVKHSLRDRKAMSMMVLFPIVLIIILGTAFSGVFGSSGIEIKAKAAYTVSGNEQLKTAFNSFKDQLEKNMKVTFVEVSDTEQNIKDIQNGDYSCYINLTDKELKIYKNQRFNLESSIIQTALTSFIERCNLQMIVSSVNPAAMQQISADTKTDYTQVVSLEKKKQPRAMDYYAVTMITLIIMYGAMTGSFSITSERTRKTGNRMNTAPVGKHEIFIGKTVGCVLVTAIQITVVFLVSKYILKTNWGDNLFPIAMVLLSQIAMVISLGVGIGLITKNEGAAVGIINSLIPVIVFFGGGYVPLEQFGNGFINTAANFSPVKWANDAIMKTIYSNDTSVVPQAILINLAIVLVFLIISITLFRREEA